MSVQILKRLFTVTEYHQMAETGILSEDDRVELIKGEIIEMSPIGSRHAACVNRLNQLFSQGISGRALVSVQNPIYLDDYSEPQPDLALLQPRDDFYAQAHPGPDAVLLVVEVAETSLGYDRGIKTSLYAQAGISEVWLIDLDGRLIEVYRQPSHDTYQQILQVQYDQNVSPQAFPNLQLKASDILG